MSDMASWAQTDDLQQVEKSIRSGHVSRGPCFVEFHVTDRCNSGCYFCNQRQWRKTGRELEYNEFRKIISRLSSVGLRAVRLSGGGDPTIHPRIGEMLDLIHAMGIHISRFDTNGILLKSDIAGKLVDCGLEILHISLQTPTPESWSQVTGRTASDFDIVLENVREFVRLDASRTTRIYASFIIDEPTFDKLEVMSALCRDLEIQADVHGLNCYAYSDHFRVVCMPVIKKQLAALANANNSDNVLLSFRPGLLSRFEDQSTLRLPIEGTGKPTLSACYAPWTGALIKANGDVYPCCGLQGKKNILGNAIEDDFVSVWLGDGFSGLRLEAENMFFGTRNTNVVQNESMKLRHLSQTCLGDCPVKIGMFSHPMLDTIFQARNRM